MKFLTRTSSTYSTRITIPLGNHFRDQNAGLITRPGMAHTLEYRRHVDNAVARLLSDGLSGQQKAILEIGLNHEQQHQELMLTDIKHVLSCNPTYPVYISGKSKNSSDVAKSTMQENLKRTDRSWIEVSGGVLSSLVINRPAFALIMSNRRTENFWRTFAWRNER